MGVFRVKTYRKRLTGAVRSFLSYSKVNSGRFWEKLFFDFCWPLLGPISNHIGPNLTLSGTKSPKRCMYLSSCYRKVSCPLYIPHILRPIYIFAQADLSGYLLSMDQVSMGICRPDIYGYLWTRYLWVFFLPEGKAVADFLIAILVL